MLLQIKSSAESQRGCIKRGKQQQQHKQKPETYSTDIATFQRERENLTDLLTERTGD